MRLVSIGMKALCVGTSARYCRQAGTLFIAILPLLHTTDRWGPQPHHTLCHTFHRMRSDQAPTCTCYLVACNQVETREPIGWTSILSMYPNPCSANTLAVCKVRSIYFTRRKQRKPQSGVPKRLPTSTSCSVQRQAQQLCCELLDEDERSRDNYTLNYTYKYTYNYYTYNYTYIRRYA